MKTNGRTVVKLKEYQTRIEESIDGTDYFILSFAFNKHLKVSALTYEIIECFRDAENLEEVKENLYQKEIFLSDKDITEFINKILVENEILEGMESKSKPNSRMWMRFPLFKSSRLRPLTKLLGFFMNKALAIFIIIAYLAILLFTFTTIYKSSLSNLQDFDEITIILISYLSIFLHEIGHVVAAHKYNVNSGDFGMGLYLLFPVAFVDLTDAWKVSYKQRVVIDLAGMYFQSIYGVIVFLAYIITGRYYLLISIQTIFMMTMLNLIPTLKLDGYWFLTDYLRVTNISIKPFNRIIGTVKKFKKNKRPNKEDIVYLLYSILYIVSVAIMLISAGLYLLDLINNYSVIYDLVETIAGNFSTLNIKMGLVNTFNLLMKLIPLIILTYIVIKPIILFFIKLIKNIKIKLV